MMSEDMDRVARVLADRLGVEPVWDPDGDCDFGPVSGVIDGTLVEAGVRRSDRWLPIWVEVYAIKDRDADETDELIRRNPDSFQAERERLTDEAGHVVCGWLAEAFDGPMRMMSTHDEWVESRPGPGKSTAV